MVACRKDEPTEVDVGYDYFPTDEGMYILYEVMEVRHDTDLIPVHDTTNYYIKERVGASYIDEMGDTAHKLFRLKGNHPDSLSMKDVWSIKRTNINAQKVEENIRIIKLGFAPSLDKEWDGNAMNNNDEEMYSYVWIDENYSINNETFESTVKVLQDDYYTFVDYIVSHEIYAKNVGMIQKIEKDFYIENFDTINVIKGTELRMNLIEYGQE